MHVELVVPALPAAQSLPRLPALELLLARGRSTQEEPLPFERWLASAFGIADAPLAAGALTALAGGRDPGDGYWLRADPVHLEIGAQGVTLTAAAALALERPEADALCGALARHLGEAFDFFSPSAQHWCLRAPSDMPIDAQAPAERTDADSVLPQGTAAGRALALATEIQMVLHDHPANRSREQRGELTINSVWLWGAGRLPRSARASWQSVSSDDPVAAGLARCAGIRHGPLPPGALHWLERAPQDGRHLCVLDPAPSAQQLQTLEQRWFEPLLQALRQGRIGMLTLRIPDSGDACETTRADLRRFWRRPRPLAAGR